MSSPHPHVGPRGADVTVLMATCGPSPLLRHALRRLRHHSPAGLHVHIAHSGDAAGHTSAVAAEFDAVWQSASSQPLRHDQALDAALPAIDTPWLIALDSDAFPIADTWLDTLVGPMLADPAVACVGPRVTSLRSVRAIPDRWNRFDYRAHVCALATRTAFLREAGVSFAMAGPEPHLGGLDTGEALTVTALASGRRVVTPAWTAWGVFGTGAVIGGAIFHAFYTTRRLREPAAFLDGQLREFFGLGFRDLELEQERLMHLEDAWAKGDADPFAPYRVDADAPDLPLPWQALVD